MIEAARLISGETAGFVVGSSGTSPDRTITLSATRRALWTPSSFLRERLSIRKV